MDIVTAHQEIRQAVAMAIKNVKNNVKTIGIGAAVHTIVIVMLAVEHLA